MTYIFRHKEIRSLFDIHSLKSSDLDDWQEYIYGTDKKDILLIYTIEAGGGKKLDNLLMVSITINDKQTTPPPKKNAV